MGRFLQRKLLEYDAMRAEIDSLRSEGGKVYAGSKARAGTEIAGVNIIVAGRV